MNQKVNRTVKSTDKSRESRAAVAASRVDRKVSDDDRLKLYRDAIYQSALPALPDIPGYHTCWLTTTSNSDTIQGRMRLGYELLKPEEVPGLSQETIKTGEWAGYVGVKEMIAAKLPLDLYQGYMAHSHHHAPAQEESRLAETALQIKREARGLKADVEFGDGLETIADAASIPEPDFTGQT